ncbi:magnesium ion transporter [Tulasnella sp. 419]|nr:magnesium ion transporter [Tulasnella sp. 419]
MNIRPCSSVVVGSIHLPNWSSLNLGSITKANVLSVSRRLSSSRAFSSSTPSSLIFTNPHTDMRSVRWSRLHTSITPLQTTSCFSTSSRHPRLPSITSVLRTKSGHLDLDRRIQYGSRRHLSWVGRRSPVRDGPSDGEEEAARAAILEKALKTRQPTDLLLRCTILDENGSVKTISGRFKKSELCAEHRLNARDLRKIDVPNLVPTILVRKEAILVQILHIRALIKSNCVILFDTYGSTETRLHSIFLYHLEHNLQAKNSGLAYEFRALESILVSVQSALDAEMVFNRHLVGSLLSELEEDIDRDKFKRLLHYSRRLTSFSNRAKLVSVLKPLLMFGCFHCIAFGGSCHAMCLGVVTIGQVGRSGPFHLNGCLVRPLQSTLDNPLFFKGSFPAAPCGALPILTGTINRLLWCTVSPSHRYESYEMGLSVLGARR